MFQDKKVIHLVARGLRGEIGGDNKLLWHIPEDMKFFRESTLGHVCLAGRKTFESFSSPLSRRLVIKVTSCGGRIPLYKWLDWSVGQGCDTLKTDKIFIIGGAQLYNSTFDVVDELWITQVFNEYPEADTFYHIPDGFEMFEEVMGVDTEDLLFTFQKWKRFD